MFVCTKLSLLSQILQLYLSLIILVPLHSQLDRLWWLWQRADPTVRLRDYGGKSAKDPEMKMASLEDVISISPLAPDVSVSDVMSTESDLLCYRYL